MKISAKPVSASEKTKQTWTSSIGRFQRSNLNSSPTFLEAGQARGKLSTTGVHHCCETTRFTQSTTGQWFNNMENKTIESLHPDMLKKPHTIYMEKTSTQEDIPWLSTDWNKGNRLHYLIIKLVERLLKWKSKKKSQVPPIQTKGLKSSSFGPGRWLCQSDLGHLLHISLCEFDSGL